MNNLQILVTDLRDRLQVNTDSYLKMSKLCTGNSDSDTLSDLHVSMNFLDNFDIKNIPRNIKPKGKIFIILSLNEPLLLSIVPILSALAVGNEVYVKPSSRNYNLFSDIWSDLIAIHSLPMHIVQIPIEQLGDYVQRVRAVYFFGSYKNAQSVYSLCAKHFVEFFPEIEATDCKIFNRNIQNKTEIVDDIKSTFENSFTHNGMVCQRISGVLIKKETYKLYVEELTEYARENNFCYDTLTETDSSIEKDILNSKPEIVLKRDTDYIVINPNLESEFTKNAYFGNIIWISSFSDAIWLIEYLNGRKFFLGININTDDTDFKDKIINETNFSRYTLNNKHCSVQNDTGWGGNWPSGSGGYRSWYETFSNKYIVLD